jgi:hypothetical protein
MYWSGGTTSLGERVIGVAAHELLGVFCLDAVDEPLFKRLDVRGIAGPGSFHCCLSLDWCVVFITALIPEHVGKLSIRHDVAVPAGDHFDREAIFLN